MDVQPSEAETENLHNTANHNETTGLLVDTDINNLFNNGNPTINREGIRVGEMHNFEISNSHNHTTRSPVLVFVQEQMSPPSTYFGMMIFQIICNLLEIALTISMINFYSEQTSKFRLACNHGNCVDLMMVYAGILSLSLRIVVIVVGAYGLKYGYQGLKEKNKQKAYMFGGYCGFRICMSFIGMMTGMLFHQLTILLVVMDLLISRYHLNESICLAQLIDRNG